MELGKNRSAYISLVKISSFILQIAFAIEYNAVLNHNW